MPAAPEVSAVIPVRNEQETVEELAGLLEAALPASHEILFVDDGSDDGTWSRLEQLHQSGRVRLVKLRAPSGKSAALMAGFANSRGAIVFTLDGDLQDDPAEIPAFLAKLAEGYDLVCGWKRVRHDPWHKVIPSRLFNFVMRQATGIQLHDMNCGFKCLRGELARSLRLHGDQHRFIPVFAVHRGYRVAEIEVRHHPRRHGHSKYGASRFLKGLLDSVSVLFSTRFQMRPAHAFGWAALGCALASAAFGALSMAQVIPPPAAIGSLVLAAVLGVSAAVLLAVGHLAESRLASPVPSKSSFAPDIEEVRD